MQNLIGAYKATDELIKIANELENNRQKIVSYGGKIGKEAFAYSAAEQVRSILMSFMPYVDICQKQLDFINNLAVEGLKEFDGEEFTEYVKPTNANRLEELRYEESSFLRAVVLWDTHNEEYLAEAAFESILEILDCFIAENLEHASTLRALRNEVAEHGERFCNARGKITFSGQQSESKGQSAAQAHQPSVEQAVSQPAQDKKPSASQQDTPPTSAPVYKAGNQTLKVLGGIVLPMSVMILAGIVGLAEMVVPLILLAIISLIPLVMGIRGNRSKCDRCGTWSAYKTVHTQEVARNQVRVNRVRFSSTQRRSNRGYHGSSVTTRQVVVPADEIIYNEIYRCKVCGHEKHGHRRVVDDKVRWG